jgi:hypothetical protein
LEWKSTISAARQLPIQIDPDHSQASICSAFRKFLFARGQLAADAAQAKGSADEAEAEMDLDTLDTVSLAAVRFDWIHKV